MLLPYASSSKAVYSQEVEEDIKDIIQLDPGSLTCRFGSLRLRNRVTPLDMAIVNDKIPLHIVKLLIDSGADYKALLLRSNGEVTKCRSIEGVLEETDSSRKEAVRNMIYNHEMASEVQSAIHATGVGAQGNVIPACTLGWHQGGASVAFGNIISDYLKK